MAITIHPIDADAALPAESQVPKYTAHNTRQAWSVLHGGGSGRPLGARSGFRVGTLPSVVTVTSTQWTLGPCAAVIDPGASTHQGPYEWASDADISGAVTAADGTNPRKDILYIRVDDASAGDGSGARQANVYYLAGPPSATPSAPDLPPRSFLVATIDVPKNGAGAPTATLNPARAVAAGGVLPIASAEIAGLVQFPALTVARTDLGGAPLFTSDGGAFDTPGGTAVPKAGAGWSLAGSLHRRYGAEGGRQVSAAFMCTYSGGAFGLSSSFTKCLTLNNPGFIPTADVFGYVMVMSSGNVVRADGAFNINPAGELWVRTFSVNYTVQPADKFYISANWNA